MITSRNVISLRLSLKMELFSSHHNIIQDSIWGIFIASGEVVDCAYVSAGEFTYDLSLSKLVSFVGTFV